MVVLSRTSPGHTHLPSDLVGAHPIIVTKGAANVQDTIAPTLATLAMCLRRVPLFLMISTLSIATEHLVTPTETRRGA